MIGFEGLATERVGRLLREAQAERLARPLVEARRAARRRRIRAWIGALMTPAVGTVPFVRRRVTRKA
jgi:hypothetical protein